MLTQARLKEVLHYDPETGVLTRIGDAHASVGTVNNYGYLRLSVSGISVYAHQVAWLYMTGEMPDRPIDHIDRDKLNNAWTNLRLCSIRENVRYQKPHADKVTSRFKGVDYVAHRKKWRARIVVARKTNYLGAGFLTEEDAARAYDAAALVHFGEFALTNKALGLLP